MLRIRAWSLIYRQWVVTGHHWVMTPIVQTGFLAALSEVGISAGAPGIERQEQEYTSSHVEKDRAINLRLI